MAKHAAERRLRRITEDAAWLTTALPKALAALSATTPTGWPTGGDNNGIGGGSDHADPTQGATLGGTCNREHYQRIDSLAAEAAGLIAQLCDEVQKVKDPGVDTEAEWNRHRCSGGTGDWADPTCTRLAVRTERIDGVAHDLCWACIKRHQRSRAKTA